MRFASAAPHGGPALIPNHHRRPLAPPATAPGGGLLWKRELAVPTSPETFASISVDPLNRRRIVLCGDAGALTVLDLDGIGADRAASSAAGARSGTGEGADSKSSGAPAPAATLISRAHNSKLTPTVWHLRRRGARCCRRCV